MSEGHLRYLCRACCREVRGPDVPHVAEAVAYLSRHELVPARWGRDLHETMTHTCVGGLIGIADLIGGALHGGPDEVETDDDDQPDSSSDSDGG